MPPLSPAPTRSRPFDVHRFGDAPTSASLPLGMPGAEHVGVGELLRPLELRRSGSRSRGSSRRAARSARVVGSCRCRRRAARARGRPRASTRCRRPAPRWRRRASCRTSTSPCRSRRRTRRSCPRNVYWPLGSSLEAGRALEHEPVDDDRRRVDLRVRVVVGDDLPLHRRRSCGRGGRACAPLETYTASPSIAGRADDEAAPDPLLVPRPPCPVLASTARTVPGPVAEVGHARRTPSGVPVTPTSRPSTTSGAAGRHSCGVCLARVVLPACSPGRGRTRSSCVRPVRPLAVRDGAAAAEDAATHTTAATAPARPALRRHRPTDPGSHERTRAARDHADPLVSLSLRESLPTTGTTSQSRPGCAPSDASNTRSSAVFSR